MLRIFLFLLTNVSVMFVLYVSMSLLGIERYIGDGNITSLIIFAAVLGFTGSFISLFLSKWVAKRTMGVTIINENNYKNESEEWLYLTVKRLSTKAGIGMPEVGFYAGEANAFATGWNKNHSLVAVSDGLFNNMTYDEVEAVIGHEIAHIANGDMVTTTLLQGILNTFVIVLSRLIGNVIDKMILKNENNGIAYYATVFILEILLTVLASVIMMWFSRYREYRADEGAAKLVSKESMINALKRLGGISTEPLPDKMVSMGISGGKLARIFSTHPALESRIENLNKLR